MKKIRVVNIQQTSNGDYLYELEMPIKIQNKITELASKAELSTEEYIRQCIVNKLKGRNKQ